MDLEIESLRCIWMVDDVPRKDDLDVGENSLLNRLPGAISSVVGPHDWQRGGRLPRIIQGILTVAPRLDLTELCTCAGDE